MQTSSDIKRNPPSGHSLFAWLRLRAGGRGSHAQGGEAISLLAYSWIGCVLARIAARVLIATSKAARDTAASTSTCSASNSPIVVSGGQMSAICEVKFCAQYRAPSLARSLSSFSINSAEAVWSWFIYAAFLLVEFGTSSNNSGLRCLKNLSHGFGMPFLRHSDTDGGCMSHRRATALVPPSRSMMLFANLSMQ